MNTFCTSTISVTRVLQMIRQSNQRILSLIIYDNNAQLNPCFRGCSCLHQTREFEGRSL